MEKRLALLSLTPSKPCLPDGIANLVSFPGKSKSATDLTTVYTRWMGVGNGGQLKRPLEWTWWGLVVNPSPISFPTKSTT
jgi:hypothetical protein